MWQDIKDNIKVYSLLLVSFFTICAGLYHFAYWQVFGINGISIVSIPDFIKSFIHPVCTGLLGIICLCLVVYSVPKVVSIKETIVINFRFGMSFLNFLLTILCFILLVYWSYKNDPRIWLLYPVIYGSFFNAAFNNSTTIQKCISNQLVRQYIVAAIAFLPLYSYCIGNYNATSIFNNVKYDYCINNINKDTLKYLGNSSQYSVFTSMNNSKNYFINTNKIDTIVFSHSKEKW